MMSFKSNLELIKRKSFNVYQKRIGKRNFDEGNTICLPN